MILPSVIRETHSIESGKNLDSWILMSKLRMNVIPSEINANSWNTKLWSLLGVYLNWVTLVFHSDFNSRINKRHFLDLTLTQMANLIVGDMRLLPGQQFCLCDILSIGLLYNVSLSMTLSSYLLSVSIGFINFVTFYSILWLAATPSWLPFLITSYFLIYHYNQKCKIYNEIQKNHLLNYVFGISNDSRWIR